jgi:hypothetical protein
MATRRDMLVRGGLVAAVTASLGLLAASSEPTTPAALVPASSPAVERSPPAAESPVALRVDLLERRAQKRAPRDVFAAHSWQRPPPPPPPVKLEPPPPPPPPSAPPLPFTFLGTFEAADGKPVFYLVEGDRVHAAGEGDVLNGVWRIEKVAAEELVLLYLPLSQPRTLSFGSPK